MCRAEPQGGRKKTPEIYIGNFLILLLNIKLHMYRVKLYKDG